MSSRMRVCNSSHIEVSAICFIPMFPNQFLLRFSLFRLISLKLQLRIFAPSVPKRFPARLRFSRLFQDILSTASTIIPLSSRWLSLKSRVFSWTEVTCFQQVINIISFQPSSRLLLSFNSSSCWNRLTFLSAKTLQSKRSFSVVVGRQMIWGVLEESNSIILKLLCEFDYAGDAEVLKIDSHYLYSLSLKFFDSAKSQVFGAWLSDEICF